MVSVTLQLDSALETKIRQRAALANRSVAEELHDIIDNAVALDEPEPANLFALALEIFGGDKGADIPEHTPAKATPAEFH